MSSLTEVIREDHGPVQGASVGAARHAALHPADDGVPPSTGTPAWRTVPTPLGPLIVACAPAGLLGAWFEGQRHFGGPLPAWSAQPQGQPLLDEAASQLTAWFEGRLTRFDLPLAPQGTAFQRAVWDAIARVGFGRTRSYGEVAAELGQPNAARAVGAATGRNPLSIIVPCHRLLGGSGALTGYAGGLARKQALLRFEAGDGPLFP